jgi:hypothetical protein
VRLTAVGAQRMTDDTVFGSAASGSPIDVLLVEDNFYDVDMTTHALKDSILPDRIKAVHDGAEALDFIFCVGSGPTRSRRKFQWSSSPIPTRTATSSAGYKLGANSFLVKRHDFDEFMKAIQALGIYWLVMNRPPLTGPSRAGPI